MGFVVVMSVNDIPEARRDGGSGVISDARSKRPWGVIIAVAIALLGTSLLAAWRFMYAPPSPTLSSMSPVPPLPAPMGPTIQTELPPEPTLLGHRAYAEADPTTLVPITADGQIQLHEAAAEPFLAMVAAARREGIHLAALSGYRSQEEQRRLFFDIKADRGQTALDRAEVSAPPGYSEHHTGYAIDIGDAQQPQTHLDPTFANTPAYDWLVNNAAHYGFELSFPPDNDQDIAFEPWHWRFVGNQDSLETFYQQ
ncbi:Putative carboxypeptidase YodJ [Halomicronema hongdechloris C2206]|uniref:Carboxypeptidase YodJ n=1 Tax=Halomicronema hongdechloris C2206 TaxID=1641165 RepID=A0A1Z3HH77_9CYAN|nr:M15 family metallopeptidase [Halomicronema hongdechloris]ASC69646.1 Putative carboxypeptidase YodJ [Halomicronema hongdechloris C2206]